MRNSFSLGLISVLCFLLLVGQPALLSQQRPLLSGKVLKNDSPLARAQLELLIPATGKVRHTTYSDPRGGYSFRGVSPGQYDLRVRYGRVLEQKTPHGWAPRRRVVLNRQPARLIIHVRSR